MLKRSNLVKIILIGCLGFLLSIYLLHKGRTNAQTGNVYIRENIATFMQSPEKIAALRTGVQVMLSRPDTDPLSWNYQANMHGTDDPRNLTAWNTCQHGSYFFFPWHRMYVYYFERILRQASGDPTLALPYWNYSDVPAQRVLPEPFRIPADPATNPLYIRQRSARINNGAPIFLNVEGVEFNPNNSIPYEIYINLPEGVTPNPESPYYVGKLALFAHDQGGTFSIEITDVLRELRQLNPIAGNSLSVTFVPPPEEIPQQIVREGSAAQLQGAVRFKRVTLTRE